MQKFALVQPDQINMAAFFGNFEKRLALYETLHVYTGQWTSNQVQETHGHVYLATLYSRVGDWKLMKGTTYGGAWDSWYGPSGRSGYTYSWPQVRYTCSSKMEIFLKQFFSNSFNFHMIALARKWSQTIQKNNDYRRMDQDIFLKGQFCTHQMHYCNYIRLQYCYLRGSVA